MFNVESDQELERINKVASGLDQKARISVRINPDVDPKTHPYISTGLKKNKFGVDIDQALGIYEKAKDMEYIEPVGIDCHIGSQLTSISPFMEALERIKDFHARLVDIGLDIKYLDLGGGLGITYDEEEPPHPAELGEALTESLKDSGLKLILEPGRVISGNAGILVTRVLYTKQTELKNFAVVDAGMNDLIRPSLYQAYHRIVPVREMGPADTKMDIVGPICESSDFLAQDRDMPGLAPDDLLAVFSSGAYGFGMSSQYNSRTRAAELLVDAEEVTVARRREMYIDLVGLENACF
jgi:diaminopimelate decarboxylase